MLLNFDSKYRLLATFLILFIFALNAVATELPVNNKKTYFNIPSQRADVALTALGKQADLSVLYQFDLIRQHKTNRLRGKYSIYKAIDILLANTGLKSEFDQKGHLIIIEDKNWKERSMTPKKSLLALMVTVLTGGAAPQALSQDTSDGTVSGLEEIVVTARKTEESLQETPISVIALSGDNLQSMGVGDLGSMDSFIPNFSSGPAMGTGFALFSIRSIGGGEGFISQESGVGVYIDDIYYPRANGALLDLIDVERVEILRGPQGTLFGRNTSGGAIRYISKKPEQEFGGEITGSIGNYHRKNVQAIANIPLNDTTAARFSFASKNKDGYIKRLNDGVEMGDESVNVARAQLRFQPNDNLDVNFSIDTIDTSNNGIARDIVEIDRTDFNPQGGPPGRGTPIDPGYNSSLVTDDPYTIVGGNPDRGTYQSTGASLAVEYLINDNLTFKSLTGYRDSEAINDQDWDGTEFLIWQRHREIEFSHITQEFQLNGGYDRLNWVAGLYFLKEKANEDTIRNSNYEPPNVPEARDVDTTSYAVFGQGTYSLSDQLQLTLGLRWSKDKKDFFGIRGSSQGSNSASWNSTTTRFGLDYQINEDIMIYTSAAQGFKAGGFNDRPRTGRFNGGIVPFDPEELWTYELGMRSEFADNRLRFNITFFQTNFENMQIPSFFTDPLTGAGAVITQNAAEATIKGIEIESLFMLTENLMFRLSGGWTDASFDDVGSSSLTLDTQFQRTPEYSYTAGLTYDVPLNNGAGVAFNMDYGWKDDQMNVTSNTNNIELPSYGLLNGRINYEAANGNWSAALFGINILDEEYLVSGFDGSTRETFTGFVQYDRGRPREFGVEVSLKF